MNEIARLDDGTPVRVMKTPMPGVRCGRFGLIVGQPARSVRGPKRLFIFRRGADGNIWLVHLRKSEQRQ